MGLFDKKYCDICGEKIGLLGNRKLEDGNLCKNCSKKLSPWFSDRKNSTVQEIKEQLAYREENKKRVAEFHTTRSYGEDVKLLIDKEHKTFMVTGASDLMAANPDVVDFADLTGCSLKVDESREELLREGADGKEVSYVPPRYEYSFDFYIILNVNHKYFNEMRFRLNENSLCLEYDSANGFGSSVSTKVANIGLVDKKDPSINLEYRRYLKMGENVVQVLTDIIDGKDIDAPVVEEKTETLSGNLGSLEGQVNQNKTETDNNLKDINNKFNNYATTESVTQVTNKVNEITTSNAKLIEFQKTITENGVEKLNTKTGIALDTDGMHIDKDGAKTGSTFDEAGVTIIDKSGTQEELNFYSGYVDDDIVNKFSQLESYKGTSLTYTMNLLVKVFASFPNFRIQETYDETHGQGLGVFHTGGDS